MSIRDRIEALEQQIYVACSEGDYFFLVGSCLESAIEPSSSVRDNLAQHTLPTLLFR